MKKFLSMVLAIAMLFGVVGSVPYIEMPFTIKALANDTEILTFTFNAEEGAYWVSDCAETASGPITIPDTYKGYPVTGIGKSAFYKCSEISSVVIPEGVKVIGYGAFEMCSGLATLYLPSTITSVDSWAFYKCTGLKRVCITDLTAWFGIDFNGDFFPNPLFYARNLFLNGEKIEDLVVPETVTVIKDNAFVNSSIKSVAIHSAVDKIDYSAFDMSDIENVFYQGTASQWTEIEIGSANDAINCADIHYEASSHVPSGVWLAEDMSCETGEPIIATQLCKYCNSVCMSKEVLTGHSFVNGTCELCGVSEYSYYINEDDEAVISGYYGAETTLVIPEKIDGYKVAVIQDLGYWDDEGNYCYSEVEDLTLPDTLKRIEGWAFYNCKNLRRVEAGSGLESIGAYAFSECTALKVVILPMQVQDIGEYAFSGCSSLKSFNVPWSLNKIADGLFADCESLESMNNLGMQLISEIGSGAFYNCKNLKSIVLTGVKSMGSSAFAGCESLEAVEIPAQLFTVTADMFYGCKSLKDISISLFNPTFNVVDGALLGGFKTRLILYPTGLTKESYTIPNTVTEIDMGAFAGCVNLKSVVVPESMTTIPYGAFIECTGLETVVLPDTITEISSEAFVMCTNLKNINIPDSVTTIGSYAFGSCEALETIEISGSVSSIGEYAFFDCTNLESINVSADNTEYVSVDGVLFNKDKTVLIAYPAAKQAKEYTVPDTVKEIASDAFYNARYLEKVVVGDNVEAIGWSAFSGCEKLTSITLPDKVLDIEGYAFFESGYYNDSANWENGALYIGNHLIEVNNYDVAEELVVRDGTRNISNYIYSDVVKSLVLPSSLENIGDSAFDSFYALEAICVDENNQNYSSADGVLYSKDKTELIRIPLNKNVDKFYVPDTVTKICKNILDGSINEFYIPLSVTTIDYQDCYEPYELVICYEGTRQQWNQIEFEDALYTNKIYFETYDFGRLYILPENEGPYIQYRVKNDKTAILEKFELNGNYDAPTYYEIPSEVDGYPIKAIGENLFKDNGLLYSINIPEGVEEIGYRAFYNCYNLNRIELPDTLVTIGEQAFEKTRYYNYFRNWEYEFYNAEINDSVALLEHFGVLSKDWRPGDYNYYLYMAWGDDIYNYSRALYIGNHLIDITRTFDNSEYRIKDGTITIATCAVDIYVKELFIPASVLSISENKLTCYSTTLDKLEVVVDKNNEHYVSVKNMLMDKQQTTLIHMPYNKDVVNKLPDTIKYINDFALKGMVVVPTSVKYIGVQSDRWEAYWDYDNYVIAYQGTQAQWDRIEGSENIDSRKVYFEKIDMGKLYLSESETGPFTIYTIDRNYEAELVKFVENGNYDIPFDYNIPTYAYEYEITSIGSGCFEECGLLYSVTIPKTVKSIGREAFYYCYNLSNITIPNSVKEIGVDAFYETAYYTDEANWVDDELYINNHLIMVRNIEEDCDYTLKSKTKGVATGAFGWVYINTLTIPEGVLSISKEAFCECNVENLILPESLSYIGRYNFKDYNVNYIFYMGSEADWSYVEICEENQVLEEKAIHFGTTEHTLKWRDVYPPTTSSEGLRQYKCIVCEYVHANEWLPVLSGFNFIANGDGTYKLSSYKGFKARVEIPDTHNNSSVTIIGNSCFKDNTSVRNIVIPTSVTEIGYLAFMNCTELQSVVIPESVTSIGEKAFYGFTGTIYCQKDSFAHRYAVENNIKYIIPCLEGADSNTRIDFENQTIYTSIKNSEDISEIVKTSPSMLVLPTPSMKTEYGEYFGTGSTVTVFDGDNYLGDYVLVVEGDLNGDAVCDVLDVVAVQRYSSGYGYYPSACEIYAANGYAADSVDANSYQNVVNIALAS